MEFYFSYRNNDDRLHQHYASESSSPSFTNPNYIQNQRPNLETIDKKLTDVNHPDHTLITYPDLGHDLSPAIGDYPGSSMYGMQKSGPIEAYALADLYSWLAAHSGFTNHVTSSPAAATSTQSANSTAK